MTKEIQWSHVKYQEHIREKMEQSVKGQNEAITLLSYIGYLYTLEILAQEVGFDKKSLPRLNALITGATGFGKTFLVKKLAQAIELPYIKIDMSSITGEGWQGASLSTALNKFLQKSPRGIGIVHLDEIDKIGQVNNGSRDIKADMQQQLLEILDGDYSLLDEDRRGVERDLSPINNALVIMTGSFQNHRNDKKKNVNMGFLDVKDDIIEDKKGWKDRLQSLGFMHELGARIVHSIELQEYTLDDIKDIIKNSKDSPLNKYHALFGLTDSTIQEEDINSMAEIIKNSKNGIRELESLVFNKYFDKYKRES